MKLVNIKVSLYNDIAWLRLKFSSQGKFQRTRNLESWIQSTVTFYEYLSLDNCILPFETYYIYCCVIPSIYTTSRPESGMQKLKILFKKIEKRNLLKISSQRGTHLFFSYYVETISDVFKARILSSDYKFDFR